ncbi:MAG: hypothetical protein M0Q91_03390 [Methanoregula sp.]|jgi:hypothetical protein|nr:hypothetical protein [Methanoregula sp.]
MARCESCGNECVLPFTCQHCGGKFCPECRLPPNHQCAGLTSWQKKPIPSVGMRYGRGSGVTATGTGYAETRQAPGRKHHKGIPWLIIMVGIIILILLAIFLLVLSGYVLR